MRHKRNFTSSCRTLLAFVTIFCATSVHAYADEPREWKSADGKFSVEAEFVDVENDIVQLRRTDNNQTVSVPIEKLGRRDQKQLRNHAGIGKSKSKRS